MFIGNILLSNVHFLRQNFRYQKLSTTNYCGSKVKGYTLELQESVQSSSASLETETSDRGLKALAVPDD